MRFTSLVLKLATIDILTASRCRCLLCGFFYAFCLKTHPQRRHLQNVDASNISSIPLFMSVVISQPNQKESNVKKTKRIKTLINGERTLVRVPQKFEKNIKCKELRSKIERAGGFNLEHQKCIKDNYCLQVSCPSCNRRLRLKLLHFAEEEKLHLGSWFLITIRIPNGFKLPGDASPYLEFKKNLHLKRAIQRLRRTKNRSRNMKPLRIIGALEAPCKTIENIPQRRQLHAHMLVSGLSKVELKKALSFIREIPTPHDKSLIKVDIKRIKRGKDNFISTLSYSVKQPIVKHSFPSAKTNKPIYCFPSKSELLELIGNYGLGSKCTDRILTVGFRVSAKGFIRLK